MRAPIMRVVRKILPLFALAVLENPLPAMAQPSPLSQAALDEIVKIYCAAWGEPDVAKRRQLLQRVWADDGTYTDPVTHVAGREALIERISAHLQKYPGSRIVPSSHADVHHSMLRFTWQFLASDGKVQTEGIDFGEMTSDGRIRTIVGFFGSLKPLLK